MISSHVLEYFLVHVPPHEVLDSLIPVPPEFRMPGGPVDLVQVKSVDGLEFVIQFICFFLCSAKSTKLKKIFWQTQERYFSRNC